MTYQKTLTGGLVVETDDDVPNINLEFGEYSLEEVMDGIGEQ